MYRKLFIDAKKFCDFIMDLNDSYGRTIVEIVIPHDSFNIMFCVNVFYKISKIYKNHVNKINHLNTLSVLDVFIR